jgi:antitoxin Phd
MSELSMSEARARLADVVDRARVAHNPVFLTRRGRRRTIEIRLCSMSC